MSLSDSGRSFPHTQVSYIISYIASYVIHVTMHIPPFPFHLLKGRKQDETFLSATEVGGHRNFNKHCLLLLLLRDCQGCAHYLFCSILALEKNLTCLHVSKNPRGNLVIWWLAFQLRFGGWKAAWQSVGIGPEDHISVAPWSKFLGPHVGLRTMYSDEDVTCVFLLQHNYDIIVLYQVSWFTRYISRLGNFKTSENAPSQPRPAL